MPPSGEIGRLAKRVVHDKGNITLRHNLAVEAASVGKFADKANISNARGYNTEGVGTNKKSGLPALPASRSSSPAISKRGNTLNGVEFGGRRRSRKHRKTRKHKKTHRRR